MCGTARSCFFVRFKFSSTKPYLIRASGRKKTNIIIWKIIPFCDACVMTHWSLASNFASLIRITLIHNITKPDGPLAPPQRKTHPNYLVRDRPLLFEFLELTIQDEVA